MAEMQGKIWLGDKGNEIGVHSGGVSVFPACPGCRPISLFLPARKRQRKGGDGVTPAGSSPCAVVLKPWWESLQLASQVTRGRRHPRCVWDRLFPAGGTEAKTGAHVQREFTGFQSKSL